jgi:hypothetical protein
MRSTWFGVCGLVGLMALAAGCRTMPPEVKPPKQPEVLSVPPSEPRYNTSVYPKEAFNSSDPFKRKEDNSVMPARMNGMGGPQMNPGMMMNQNQRPIQ